MTFLEDWSIRWGRLIQEADETSKSVEGAISCASIPRLEKAQDALHVLAGGVGEAIQELEGILFTAVTEGESHHG